MTEPVALAWSGGRDSALALWELRRRGGRVVALLTTVGQDDGRVTMHGVPGPLLRRQAGALRLPLVEVAIPAPCPDAVYEARMAAALARPPLDGVGRIAFGDLFLVDVRAYREERLAAAGRCAEFPLWGSDTTELAHRFLDLGFAAVVTCVDTRRLDRSFAGRPFDAALLGALPPGVDPCGERGELHTFVFDGPGFSSPVAHEVVGVVEWDGYAVADLAVPRSAGGGPAPALIDLGPEPTV